MSDGSSSESQPYSVRRKMNSDCVAQARMSLEPKNSERRGDVPGL